MKQYLSKQYKDLLLVAASHAREYALEKPFPHARFNNFFDTNFLDNVLGEFPNLYEHDNIGYDNQKEIKRASKGEKSFGTNTKKLMHFLNSEPFLQFLQVLTGIKEPLIGDPYFVGGGMHEISRGGMLKIHSDFNKHPVFNLDRRVNVLVYLNKNWKEEYGGHFEMWNQDMDECKAKVLPKFNTLVIFSTTDYSYHGHPEPLNCPPSVTRKSLALYYYSNGRPRKEVNIGLEKHSTLFKARKNSKDDKKAFSLLLNVNPRVILRELTPPLVLRGLKKVGFGKKKVF